MKDVHIKNDLWDKFVSKQGWELEPAILTSRAVDTDYLKLFLLHTSSLY